MTDKLLPEFCLTIIESLIAFSYPATMDLLLTEYMQCIIIIIRIYLQDCKAVLHFSFLDSSTGPLVSGWLMVMGLDQSQWQQKLLDIWHFWTNTSSWDSFSFFKFILFLFFCWCLFIFIFCHNQTKQRFVTSDCLFAIVNYLTINSDSTKLFYRFHGYSIYSFVLLSNKSYILNV